MSTPVYSIYLYFPFANLMEKIDALVPGPCICIFEEFNLRNKNWTSENCICKNARIIYTNAVTCAGTKIDCFYFFFLSKAVSSIQLGGISTFWAQKSTQDYMFCFFRIYHANPKV